MDCQKDYKECKTCPDGFDDPFMNDGKCKIKCADNCTCCDEFDFDCEDEDNDCKECVEKSGFDAN